MIASAIYVVDRETTAFERHRLNVDVVCAGDSITGWNNFGSVNSWPYRTYPEFLQQSCEALDLRIANGGIAGEISQNGIGQVRDYLNLFPNARNFVVGYGTNDLGMWPDVEATSERIIENLGQMVRLVAEQGNRSVLFNVPYANESMFLARIARELHEKRDYHNARLKEFCDRQQIPLADICSRLVDEHFGDELHPNDQGAKIVAEEVFKILAAVHKEG